jgi:hypothetical protein
MDIKRMVVCKIKLNFYKTGLSQERVNIKSKNGKEEIEGEMNLGDKKMEGINVIWVY